MRVRGRLKRSGLAIPIVFVILMVMFLIIFGLFKLMRGLSGQLEYADAHIRALSIAESGYNRLVARLMGKPWEDRWFAAGPDAGANQAFDDGYWDYFIADTPGDPMTADVWVRGRFRETQRLLFYRVRYRDLLFKGLTSPLPKFAGSTEETGGALSAGQVNPLTEKMNQLIRQRDANRTKAVKITDETIAKIDPVTILTSLGAAVGVGVLDKSLPPPGGGSTLVLPLPVIPQPAGSTSCMQNLEKVDVFVKWLEKQPNIGSRFINERFIPAYHKAQRVIDTSVREQNYVVGEKAYKDFIRWVYSLPGSVDQSLRTENARYQQEVATLPLQYSGQDLTDALAEAERRHQANLDAIAAGQTVGDPPTGE